MFYLDVMNNNVAKFHKSVVTTYEVYTLFYGTVLNIFLQLSIQTTRVIALKIWTRTAWTMSLDPGYKYKVEHTISTTALDKNKQTKNKNKTKKQKNTFNFENNRKQRESPLMLCFSITF